MRKDEKSSRWSRSQSNKMLQKKNSGEISGGRNVTGSWIHGPLWVPSHPFRLGPVSLLTFTSKLRPRNKRKVRTMPRRKKSFLSQPIWGLFQILYNCIASFKIEIVRYIIIEHLTPCRVDSKDQSVSSWMHSLPHTFIILLLSTLFLVETHHFNPFQTKSL